MDKAGDWSGKLLAWSEFLLFHVLPIAVAQIYDWIRDWQILVVGLLALLCFYLWSRHTLRAARRAARETVLAESRAFDGGLKLLRREIEQLQAAQPKSSGQPVAVADPAPIDPYLAIEQLRHTIRLALGTIPVSDDPLTKDSVRLYLAAISSFSREGIAEPSPPNRALNELLAELAELGEAYPPQSCRQAWLALVKINALAREFHDFAKAQAGGPNANAAMS